MAKGRKLTVSRSERYLESYSYGSGYSSNESEVTDFVEEDVWSMVGGGADRGRDDMEDSPRDWSSRAAAVGNGAVPIIRGRRAIPQRDDHHLGGLSLAFEDSPAALAASPRIVHQFRGNDGAAASPRGGRHMASSAPVNVPDWSKIYRADSVESMHDSDDGFEDHETEMVPPHEYLAREYARSRKMVATSVLEGQGRTLKGRDMSRVRDAVWSQTGFDG